MNRALMSCSIKHTALNRHIPESDCIVLQWDELLLAIIVFDLASR